MLKSYLVKEDTDGNLADYLNEMISAEPYLATGSSGSGY